MSSRESIQHILNSGLFDVDFYLNQYKDVAKAGVDPLEHYAVFGWVEGRNPNAFFNTNWYARKYLGGTPATMNPLLHYLQGGIAAGCNPGPEFDAGAYLVKYPDIVAAGVEPLAHYLRHGKKEGRSINALREFAPIRVLVVSTYAPSRAHAGGLRLLDLYETIKNIRNNAVIDLFTFNRPEIDWDISELDNIFDNVYLAKSEDINLKNFLSIQKTSIEYDVVDLQFSHTGKYINEYKNICKKIVYTPMESDVRVLYLNLNSRGGGRLSQKTVLKKLEINQRETLNAAREIIYCMEADQIVCVSADDAHILKSISGTEKVTFLETGISNIEFREQLKLNYKNRRVKNQKEIIYIAYFGSQTNVDALRWFMDNVHDLIKKKVPDYTLSVIGRGDLSIFKNMRDPNLNVVGEVDRIAPYMEAARLGIAPALHGSGFRGKINQYSICALPCVAASLAANGLGYKDGESIFEANDAASFAARCIELLCDDAANEKMSRHARNVSLQNHTWASKKDKIVSIYNLGDSK